MNKETIWEEALKGLEVIMVRARFEKREINNVLPLVEPELIIAAFPPYGFRNYSVDTIVSYLKAGEKIDLSRVTASGWANILTEFTCGALYPRRTGVKMIEYFLRDEN